MGWREEIEGLIERENRAWNDGDAVAYSEAVEPDCVFTNVFGQVFVGQDAFERQHARLFAKVYKGSRLGQTIRHLRLVRPGVALVDTSSMPSLPAGDLGRPAISLFFTANLCSPIILNMSRLGIGCHPVAY